MPALASRALLEISQLNLFDSMAHNYNEGDVMNSKNTVATAISMALFALSGMLPGTTYAIENEVEEIEEIEEVVVSSVTQ